MQKENIIKVLLFFAVAFNVLGVFANNPQQHHEEGQADQESLRVDTKREVKEYISHHLQDSYDFTFKICRNHFTRSYKAKSFG